MVANALLVALVASSAMVAAAPAPANKGFSVTQEKVPKTERRHPAAHLAKALHKYKGTVPENVILAASGQVTTNPTQFDEQYVTKVTVGASTLRLDFDTGSSDLWAFSSQLPSSERTGHSYYVPSSTAQKLTGDSWSISYGDGSGASGNVYADKVVVGGVTATRQAVEAATSVSTQFVQDTSIDGLLGLAFSSINTVTPTKQKTFFDTVKSSLSQPLFAAYLKHQAPGVYDFGFTDSSKYTGSIVYTPVDSSQGFWSFTANSYAIGGQQAGGAITGIADTGTTLLLLPDNVVNDYYANTYSGYYDYNQGGYLVDCSEALPSFAINVNGYEAVVPGAYINYAPVDSTYCFGGIQSNSGIGFSIFGDVFLKSQYVVFDASGPKLGLAKQA